MLDVVTHICCFVIGACLVLINTGRKRAWLDKRIKYCERQYRVLDMLVNKYEETMSQLK